MESITNVSTTGISTQKRGAAAVAIVVIVASVLAMASSVSAQPGPAASCTGAATTSFGTQYYGYDDFENRLYSTSILSREYALTSPLDAGTYVLDAVSYDGYPGRETIAPQAREQWYAELLAADGTVLATSGVTGDLADEVEEATWSGVLGEVTIAATATGIRTVHAAAGSLSVNSVRPVCLGASVVVEEPVVEEPEVPAPGSTITVDFDSTADAASSITLLCGELEESATGTSVDLVLTDISAGAGCAVRYPDDLVCSLAVTPASRKGAVTEGGVNIRVPDAGGANILVDIDCEQPQIAGTPTTTTTTAPAVVEAAVEAKVETKVAPAAQVQPGTPAFTG